MKHIRGFHESGGWTIHQQLRSHRYNGSCPISKSDLEQLEDLFVTVADSWDLIPIPTEGYDNKSHFHGDYTMTIDGDSNDFVNLEFDIPLVEVTPEMESSLKTFLKRLSVYGWSYVPYSEGRDCNRIINTPGLDYDSVPVREWNFAIWKDSPIREGFFDWFKRKPRGFTLQDRMKWVTDIVDKYVTEDLRIKVKGPGRELFWEIQNPSFYFNFPFGKYPWDFIDIWKRKDGMENLIEVVEPYRAGRDAPGHNVTKFQSKEIYDKCHELYLKQVNKGRFYMSLIFLINRYSKYDSDFIFFSGNENINPLWEKFNADNKEYSFFKYPNTVNLFRTLEYIQDELNITLSNQDKSDIKKYLLGRDTLKDLRII